MLARSGVWHNAACRKNVAGEPTGNERQAKWEATKP
jgi:hypothetical protein